MRRLRLWCVLFFAWLFVLYNIERLHEPINLASFVYVAAAVVGGCVILFPRLQQVPLPWLLAIPVPVVLAAKLWLRYPIGGPYLPTTVTELCAVEVTLLLAWQVGRRLEEFRAAVTGIVSGHLRNRSRRFLDGQGRMYREIRRARQYQRPLSLLAIAPAEKTIEVALDRFVAEIEQATVRAYVSARIAEFLSSHMSDCDIITQLDGHFVTLLPEIDRQQATEVVRKLQAAAKEQLGLELEVGLSVFPEEEVTLVGLLERAEEIRGNGNGHRHNGHSRRRSANGSSGNGDIVAQHGASAAATLSGKASPGTVLGEAEDLVSDEGPRRVNKPR